MTQQPLTGIPYRLPTAVQADVYGPSPLVTDLSITSPGMFVEASERSAAPTLFATGDLPPFTSSGVDPALLERLPYTWRHHAASTPDRGEVLSMLETATQDPGSAAQGTFPAPGLEDYRIRVERWVAGLVHRDELGEGEQPYPESWTSADRFKRQQQELEAEQRQAQAAHDQSMTRLREEREATVRNQFLLGGRADQSRALDADEARGR